MISEKSYIREFQRDSNFYGKLDLILVIKSFDLVGIRKRWLLSQQNKSGKSGSVERREPAVGGLAHVNIQNGKFQHANIIHRCLEPRGIHVSGQKFAFSSARKVHIWDSSGYRCSTNDWYSYIHTVEFSRQSNHILISSSGFDTILEIDYVNDVIVREWCAWENGFNQAHNPKTGKSFFLTRSESQAAKYHDEGIPYRYISDPKEDYLPTAMRAAFINGAYYSVNNVDQILATFFHEGSVYMLNLNSSQKQQLIGGLKNPHGGKQVEDYFFVTNTSGGSVIIKRDKVQLSVEFVGLPGKKEDLGSREWLQNSIKINSYYITIDSNRNAIVVFDPVLKLYDMIPYDENWAIQDLINIDGKTKLPDFTQISISSES